MHKTSLLYRGHNRRVFSGCSRCNDSYTVVIEALGHAYVNHAAKAPSCTEVGWEAYTTCSRCDYSTYVEIPAKGHTAGTPFKDNFSEGISCTVPGSYDLVTCCTVCAKEISRETIDNYYLPHTEVSVSAIEPTCTKYGYTAGTICSVCGQTLSGRERIDKIPHTVVTVEGLDPTCTKAGYTESTVCSVCNTVITPAETIPALGHSYGEWTVIREATFNTDGLEGYVCERCGAEVAQKISMWTVYPRVVRFYPISGIKFIVNDKVKVSSYKEIEHPVAYDLTFTVEQGSNFGFEGYYVYLDGEIITPDENGVYTIPGGSMDTQTISVSGIVSVDDDNNIEYEGTTGTHQISFWEWLMNIFKKIAALFAGK